MVSRFLVIIDLPEELLLKLIDSPNTPDEESLTIYNALKEAKSRRFAIIKESFSDDSNLISSTSGELFMGGESANWKGETYNFDFFKVGLSNGDFLIIDSTGITPFKYYPKDEVGEIVTEWPTDFFSNYVSWTEVIDLITQWEEGRSDPRGPN